jgi:hypothetical protein
MMCRTLVHELCHEKPKTTKELLDIATRHASGKEAVGAAFILANAGMTAGGGRATPTKATAKRARKGTKGGKKGQKCWPHHIAIMASNGNGGEEADNSGKGFVAAVERDFMWQTQSPKDHFENLFEAQAQGLHHDEKIHGVRGSLQK